MKGTEFTFQKLGEVAARIYNLHSFGMNRENDGEFLTFERSDVTRYAVHIHFYKRDFEATEDEVKIACHAIWSKSKEGWYRQQLTLHAVNHGRRWTATMEEGDELWIEGEKPRGKFDPPPNQELKERLFTEVVNLLPDILADTLNDK